MTHTPTVREKRSLLAEARLLCERDACCVGVQQALRTIALIAFAGGLSRVPAIADSMCLKGGTLLRLWTAGSIGRPPSKDLDASVLTAGFVPSLIDEAVIHETNALLAETFFETMRMRAELVRRPDDVRRMGDAHLYVFRLHVEAAITPSNPRRLSRLDDTSFKFEASTDEVVDKAHLIKLDETHHGLPIRLRAYAPLQAMAEKLRALLQKRRYLEIAGDRPGFQGNVIPRHVMDLELLITRVKPEDLTALPDLFARKCDAKSISLDERTPERFLTPELQAAVRLDCFAHKRDFVRVWSILEDLVGRVCR